MNGIEIFLTVTEAAEKLSVDKEEIKQLVSMGVIIPYRAHPNDTRYLIPNSEIEKLLASKLH